MSGSGAGSSVTSSAKERHYAYLSSQLQTLSSNIVNAQDHLSAAANQARYIRSLGTNQAALFMATLHQVDQDSSSANAAETTAPTADDRQSD